MIKLSVIFNSHISYSFFSVSFSKIIFMHKQYNTPGLLDLNSNYIRIRYMFHTLLLRIYNGSVFQLEFLHTKMLKSETP